MPSTQTPPSYTSRDYDTLVSEIQALVLATRPDLYSDFVASGLGQFLIEQVAYAGDIVSNAIDVSAGEAFIATCRTRLAAVRYAKGVGYKPRSNVAATLTLTLASIPTVVNTNGGTIAPFVTSTNGTRFELLTTATIPSSTTSYSLSLVEGTSYAQMFPAVLGQAYRTITCDNATVAQGSWSVTVGGTPWTEVQFVATQALGAQVYQTFVNGDGRLSVTFGDGTNGAIPNAAIVVAYRTCAGAAGNVGAGMTYTGTIVVTGGGGTTVPFTAVAASAASGGMDQESLAALKQNVPAFMRTSDRAITLKDYAALALTRPNVALSLAQPLFSGYTGNAVRVCAWSASAGTLTGTSLVTPRQSTAGYVGYAVASGTVTTDLKSYIGARTPAGTLTVVEAPGIAYVDLYFNGVVYDANYDPAVVHAAFTAAVAMAAEASDGFSFRLSTLYRALHDVPGIIRFSLDRIVFELLGRTAASGSVTFQGQPGDGDTVTINDGASSVTFEFDGNGSTTSGTIAVAIGASASDTAVALATAINANMENIEAARTTVGGNPVVALMQTKGGAYYNLPVSSTGSQVTVAGMTGGDDTTTTQRQDYRANPSASPDPWPVGTYAAGTPWQDGGVLPYLPLRDVDLGVDVFSSGYYSEATVYNNTIVFNSGPQAAVVVQAINVRRLVFELEAQQ